jgi:hypothetical protein
MNRQIILDAIKKEHKALKELYALLELAFDDRQDEEIQNDIKRNIINYLLQYGENTKDNCRVVRMNLFYKTVLNNMHGIATLDTIKALMPFIGFHKVKHYSNKDGRQHWSYSIDRDIIHNLCNEIGIDYSEEINDI